MKKRRHLLPAISIILLCITSIGGILSMNFSYSYDMTNQYGSVVKMFGFGIYAHDSYFKAPILIGSDFAILLVLVPIFIYTHIKHCKNLTDIHKLKLASVYAVALYYAASLSLGVTYNQFHLVYIALFSCTLFGMFQTLRSIAMDKLEIVTTKGIKAYLMLTGIALVLAWMPDILPTLSGGSLRMIEVYTTEITYVLDIGIIGPLCLVCLHLLNKKDPLGIVILALILKTCIVVGIMMIPQTICQLLSGYEIPLPIFIGKSGSFIALGVFAFYFEKKLYRQLSQNESKEWKKI